VQSGPPQRTLIREKTVPASLLAQQADGTWTLPRWLVERDILRQRERAEVLPWPGLAAIEAELKAAAAPAKADLLSAQQERVEAEARRKEEAARSEVGRAALQAELRERDAELRALTSQDGEFTLALAKPRLTLADLAELGVRLDRWPRWLPSEGIDAKVEVAGLPGSVKAYEVIGPMVRAVRRHPDFSLWREQDAARAGELLRPTATPRARVPDQVIAKCTVHWAEWVGPSSARKRVDHAHNAMDGCMVEVYGKRHEIELPDGSVITKMAGPNLKILPASARRLLGSPSTGTASGPND
jgi:hypothetical protein